MLYEEIGALHTVSGTTHTAITCSADKNSPTCLDWTMTYPTVVNSGDLCFWVQVASSGTSGTDTYAFKLRGSATVDGSHDLNGTIVDLVVSPTYTQSGTFCLKTDPRSHGLYWAVVPSVAQNYRYWQGYIDVTSVAGNLDLTVYMGVALRHVLKTYVGNIANAAGMAFP